MACSTECRIDEGADDGTRDDISEVTKRHRDGGRNLANDIEWGEHRDGLSVALEITADAIGFNLGGGNKHEHQYRPAQLSGKIRRGREQTQQTR